ncbi:HAMP domain-containing histidine kinase [Patescibacteria group bacterium]|nr:HAMP domain-containing histidine kinase [Patescibacteria group bacterium]
MKIPRLNVFLQFVLLGTVVFILLGIFLSTLIAPALTTFILDQRELNSVVFANRLAADILTSEDFTQPVSGEEDVTRFERFSSLLQVPGLFRIKIYRPDGTIIYSDEKRLIGAKFPLNEELEQALKLKSTAEITEFNANDPRYEYEISFIRGLEVYTPITFGSSAEVIGVVQTFSRVGFIEQQIDELKTLFTQRVALSLLVMFTVLSLIVWRASRTVNKQRRELLKYASGLAAMVDTRTRELKETSEREIEKAKELLKLKDQFVFVAAHELRTPLNAIKWGLSVLESNNPEMVVKDKHLFTILRKSNERLLFLVKDILDVARIEGGTLKLKIESISAAEAIADAVIEVKSEADQLQITIDNTVPENIPPVRGDILRLKEIFVNLLTNAAKYSQRGSTVVVSAEVKDENIVFHVIDTGIGISTDQKKHIFEKFWRSPEAQHTEGTGLGLFIVKQLVQFMSGEIWFESEKGKGTTFSFSLKRADSAAKDEEIHET